MICSSVVVSISTCRVSNIANNPREIFWPKWQYMHYYVLLFNESNRFAIRIKSKYVLWLSLWISSSTVSSQIFIFFSADSKLISTTYRNFSMTLFLSHSLCEIDFTEKSLEQNTHLSFTWSTERKRRKLTRNKSNLKSNRAWPSREDFEKKKYVSPPLSEKIPFY